ncbi:MAG: 23S rRNA (adenine(2503)-C(2))-methyltransferase RlmN [Planctomycetota bacterium]
METPRQTYLRLAPAEAAARIEALGGKPFHAAIVRREVFENARLDYEEMTGLSKELRDRLTRELPLLSTREIARSTSADGTQKLLLELASGDTVETVWMPARERGATVCVSTQVGCPVACPFCASGKLGLTRNLAAHEIVEQFLHARGLGPIARAVVMGIGEPLLNYTALAAALGVVNEELGLGARRITVSTVGFPARLDRIAPTRPPFQLAISLHSPFDRQRWELVPAMDGVPVEEILAAGDRWFEVTGREVTYEYVLLGGTNDSEAHAHALAERLARRRATVNLIPFNPIDGSPFERPSSAAADAFRDTLRAAGIVATVRWSRGLESDAACGQLRIQKQRDPSTR